MHFLLMIAYALLNRLRGSGKVNKLICYFGFGVLFCVTAYVCGWQASLLDYTILLSIASVGSWYGFNHCWGKYFPQPLDTSAEVCVKIVNDVTTRLYIPYTPETPVHQAILWKTIAMSFRFIIFFAPKYLFCMLFLSTSGAPASLSAFIVVIALLSLAGPLYWLGFTIAASKPQWNKYNIPLSELMVGALFSLCDWVAFL